VGQSGELGEGTAELTGHARLGPLADAGGPLPGVVAALLAAELLYLLALLVWRWQQHAATKRFFATARPPWQPEPQHDASAPARDIVATTS
jgi:hypothetical protein